MSNCSIFIPLHQDQGGTSFEVAWTTGIIILLFSPITTVGNGFVVAAILFDPFKNIRVAPSSYIILNLALADLLVGVVIDPMFSIALIQIAIYRQNVDSLPDHTTVLIAAIASSVSLYSLVALTVDRLIAIKIPLQYASRVTKKKIRNTNILMWISAVIQAATILITQCSRTSFIIITGTHVAMAVVLLTVLNIAMIFAAQSQATHIKKTVDLNNRVILENAFAREKAVTRTSAIMIVAFQACLLPYAVVVFGWSLFKDRTYMYAFEGLLWFHHVAVILAILNSLMNPFLYAWRLPKYRKAFQCIFTLVKEKVFSAPVQCLENTADNPNPNNITPS